MAPYAARLDAKKDGPPQPYLDTRHIRCHGKPLFVGAVRINKPFVGDHRTPVCVKPALRDGTSPAPKRRMHGKSCLDFSEVDETPFDELASLTKAGFASGEAQASSSRTAGPRRLPFPAPPPPHHRSTPCPTSSC